MLKALDNYEGQFPLSGAVSRDYDGNHQILHKAGTEIALLIENTQQPGGGTISSIWVHPHLLLPPSKTYLETVVALAEPCL